MSDTTALRAIRLLEIQPTHAVIADAANLANKHIVYALPSMMFGLATGLTAWTHAFQFAKGLFGPYKNALVFKKDSEPGAMLVQDTRIQIDNSGALLKFSRPMNAADTVADEYQYDAPPGYTWSFKRKGADRRWTFGGQKMFRGPAMRVFADALARTVEPPLLAVQQGFTPQIAVDEFRVYLRKV